MKREYESIAKNICQISNLQTANLEDLEGAIGVACMLAFIKGVKANLPDLADNIGVDVAQVEKPFFRLMANGIFSNHYGAREDNVLRGKGYDKIVTDGKIKIMFSAVEQSKNAWCQVAGIASDLTGLREFEQGEKT